MDFGQTDDEIDDYVPEVTSADPAERKLARSLRIKRRIEAIKKQHEPLTQEEIEANKTQLEVQILKSAENLETLLTEGEELISNVSIGADGREAQRREKEREQRNNLIEQIEAEVESAEAQYQEIEERWMELMYLNDPLDINDGIIEQKSRCQTLIRQKNDMISKLRAEVDRKEIEFETDQVQQKGDLVMLANRIDQQVDLMKSAYRNELKLIDLSVTEERKKTMEANLQHWEELYKDRKDLEDRNMYKRCTFQIDFLTELQENRVENEELFRETKIALENENQCLQQELEYLKSFCLLNGEKLNYNYQIVKKREEENIIIRAQQKRLLNKLRDELNNLRQKGEDYRKQADIKAQKLVHEIKRLRNSVFNVEAKADLMTNSNEKKYLDVWQYNEDVAKEKLQQILTTDRSITEQLLGIDWVYPKFTIHDKRALPSYRAALIELERQNTNKTESEANLFDPASEDFPFPDALQQHILSRIGDRSGIILEKQLRDLIKTIERSPGNLIKVEAFFEALGITKLEDIDFMLKSFLPYLVCEDCDPDNPPTKKIADQPSGILASSSSQVSSLALVPLDDMVPATHLDPKEIGDIVEVTGHETIEEDHNESNLSPDTVNTDNQVAGPSESQDMLVSLIDIPSKKQPDGSEPNPHIGHNLSLDAAFVHKALKNFVLRFNAVRNKDLTIPQRVTRKRNTISRLLSHEDVQLYWKQFEKAFPIERQRTWDALLHGMTKYYEVLKDRHKINEEVVKLRRQNAELKHLLKKCSPANAGNNRVSTAQFSAMSRSTTFTPTTSYL